MNNIRSLSSRLRRLERKSGAGSARDFYDKLTDDELWAILELPIRFNDGYDNHIEYFVETLGIPQKKAQALVLGLDQVRRSLAREYRHLSDGELVELINAPMFPEPLSDEAFDDDE